MTKNVFIIGSRGIPAKYGGFETFAQKLIENRESLNIKYFIASLRSNNSPVIPTPTFEYKGATVFQIDVEHFGAATPIVYDIKAILWSINFIKNNHIEGAVIYILGNTIGPLLTLFRNQFQKWNVKVFVNPDGLEWKRAKWPRPVRSYLKFAEASMVKTADLIISDNPGIEEYLHHTYSGVNFSSKYIAYGVETPKLNGLLLNQKAQEWLKEHHLIEGKYYLVVGRFIPENNYETILREFMDAHTDKKLVIITQASGKFFDYLKSKTHFDKDSRIMFVGTVYDSNLLYFLRKKAYGYIHGHSVGGTNPSLLEALSTTKLNLLYDVNFNRYVGQESALYWSLEYMNLAKLIEKADGLSSSQIESFDRLSKKRISSEYSWKKITKEYENLFLKG
ncbi:beta 1-4 rhamnosyltransferase Cps2T [Weissella paramesenteroides]